MPTPCCTTTTRCAVAHQLATRYHAAQRRRAYAALGDMRDAARAYTYHLTEAGVLAYPATAIPSDPATWEPQAHGESWQLPLDHMTWIRTPPPARD